MSSIVASRGCQADHHARHLFPLSGRRGAFLDDVSWAGPERPVDTIAVARKAAEEKA